jgi:endoglycosylceramidase
MTNPAISTRGQRFMDSQGRQVILHGVNLVNKNPNESYLGSEREPEFAAMRAWGFNCLRLGVFWDGLEPQPGVINQDYLLGLDQRIAWAKQNGLYVILDMHQDLYSVLYSDGAPAWATLTGGAPHIVAGGVWSDAYFTSPAVQTALDNFWDNTPAPDGVGLQDHFAACWQALARRYAGEPAVIGCDLLNEPFPGSAALKSQMMLFTRGAELLAAIDPSQSFSADELALQWLDPAGRCAILARLEDPALYARIIAVTQPIYSEFERQRLMPFYRRVAAAIQAVDPDRILFLETSMGSNMGVYSAIEPIRAVPGSLSSPQAYAPHGYDLVVDTPYLASASPARVELIFQRHGETANRLGLPMLVGEWGAFDSHISGTLPAAWAVSRMFERLLCGDTYWHFTSDLDQQPPFQAISRPYPERVAGELVSYHFSPQAGAFECIWNEDPAVSAPSRVYLPAWFQPQSRQIHVEPAGEFRTIPAGMGVWLEIPPLGQPGRRALAIR